MVSTTGNEGGVNENQSGCIGVIFDMDGVLVDSAGAHLESWKLMAQEHGLSVTESQVAATFGRQNRDIIPVLFGEVSERRLKALGDRKEELYRNLVRGRTPLVEGAADLVRGLADRGAKLAIGSSAPRANIDLVLEAMGLSALFGVVVSGDEVTRGKPDPQVFTMACDRLGIVPARCVVIEDAPAGVTAAKRAGAKGVAVLIHHERDAFDGADAAVSRLADLTVEAVYKLVDGSL